MPIEEVPNTGLRYHLIAFDDEGRERGDDPAGRMSQVTAATLTDEPITDVFIFSHCLMADSSRRGGSMRSGLPPSSRASTTLNTGNPMTRWRPTTASAYT
jgi:hypothetical protein